MESNGLLFEGGGPLFNAVIPKDTEVLQLLLVHGADPNAEHEGVESLYAWAEFDYRYDEYDLRMPEEPKEEDKASEDTWLDYLDRLAQKYGKRRPDCLRILRKAGAKGWSDKKAEKTAR